MIKGKKNVPSISRLLRAKFLDFRHIKDIVTIIFNSIWAAALQHRRSKAPAKDAEADYRDIILHTGYKSHTGILFLYLEKIKEFLKSRIMHYAQFNQTLTPFVDGFYLGYRDFFFLW